MNNTNSINNNNENKYDSSIITTKKFNSNKWNMIEKPLSESDKKRNEIILNLGKDISFTSNELFKTNISTIGNYYYKIVKDELKNIIDFKLNDNIKKSEFESEFL